MWLRNAILISCYVNFKRMKETGRLNDSHDSGGLTEILNMNVRRSLVDKYTNKDTYLGGPWGVSLLSFKLESCSGQVPNAKAERFRHFP